MPGLRFVVLLVLVSISAARADAIALLSPDDFESGTTEGWGVGSATSPHQPSVALDAGPLGTGDDSLLLTSSGSFGAGSNLVVMNPVPFTGPSQWTGNYTAAGVGMIWMQVRNPSNASLSLRIGVGAGNSLSSDGFFVTTNAIAVPANSGWRTLAFPLSAADLTFSLSTTPLTPISNPATALTDVTQLRLLHAVAVSFRGEPIAAQLLVDNVVAVPEPAFLLQLGCAISALGALEAVRKLRGA
jgi:hypothetical protein